MIDFSQIINASKSATYIYRFDVAAIIVCLSIFYGLYKTIKVKTRVLKCVYLLLSFTTTASIFDLVSCILQNNAMNYNVFWLYLFKILYQVTFHSIPVSYFFVTYFITNDNKKPDSWQFILLYIPYYISMLLSITSGFTKFIVYYDVNHAYHHGPLIYALYVEAAIYIVACFYRFIHYRNRFHTSQLLTVTAYTIASVGSLIAQIFLPRLRLVEFIISISILIGYLALENQGSYDDPEMKIFNQNAFKSNLKSILEENQPLYMAKLTTLGLDYVSAFVGKEAYSNILEKISKTLLSIFPKKCLYRYSADSVIVILDSDSETRTKQLIELQKYMNKPVSYEQDQFSLTFEKNFFNYPDDAKNFEEIISIIDNSKTITNGDFSENTQQFNKNALEKNQRENHILELLNNAIQNDAFDVYYQPIYSISQHRFTAAEALIRLTNSDIGYVSPKEFIPIAEKNDLLIKIGKIVFSDVFHFLSSSRLWEYGIHHINVNLSPIQCIQENFYSYLTQMFADYKVSPQYLNFEITYSSSESTNSIIRLNMNNLKRSNINFYLDSYGSGFSNITNLTSFPFTAVKINQNEIWRALSDEKAKIVLKESIMMVKSLKMAVVAEGIETHDQAMEMITMGCDYLQGFYYSEPLPSEEFFQLVLRN